MNLWNRVWKLSYKSFLLSEDNKKIIKSFVSNNKNYIYIIFFKRILVVKYEK